MHTTAKIGSAPDGVVLTGINRYPVKSCRGESLQTSAVEPWGLVGDRRWMVIDDTGQTVTAREHTRLLLVRPLIVDGGLLLSGSGADDLFVRRPDNAQVDVRVFSGPFQAALADDAAHAWFRKFTDTAVRLIHQDDPRRRPTDPEFTKPDDRVSLADSYPIMMASEESLDALVDLIDDGAGRMTMTRFRPNLVVRGAPAWAEDTWRRLRIGTSTFRVVKGCDRCVFTTIDPDTLDRGKEPIVTLARHRKWDGRTWFGVQLVPDTAGGEISVGDEIELLAWEPSDGPLR